MPGVLYHHERFDGAGYPSGLAGESIPLIGRIICLADGFDAMTSSRTYRHALPMAWQRSLVTYLVLTVVAGFATAGIEFAWYALATGINPWRVLAASETITFGLRPAHYVILMGLGVTLLASVRRVVGLLGPKARLVPSRT